MPLHNLDENVDEQHDIINPFADFEMSGMNFAGDQGMFDGGWADQWLVDLLRESLTAGGPSIGSRCEAGQ